MSGKGAECKEEGVKGGKGMMQWDGCTPKKQVAIQATPLAVTFIEDKESLISILLAKKRIGTRLDEISA